MTMRGKIVAIMGFIMLIGFALIGFFIIPVGIPLCAAIGIGYGIKHKDALFTKWSVAALVIGLISAVYTCFLVQSM